jgi:restriction system protein
MPIPDYQSVMLPLLRLAGDQQEHTLREAVDTLSVQFNLTAQERRALLPNGQQLIFVNRVVWALTFMYRARLLAPTPRRNFRITKRGFEVLRRNPAKIDVKFLDQFKEFREFRALRGEKAVDTKQVNAEKKEVVTEKKEVVTEKKEVVTEKKEVPIEPEQPPQQSMEQAYRDFREKAVNELLGYVKRSSLSVISKILVELLTSMGYAGGRKDFIKTIGKMGNERIGLIVKEDPLGFDVIYIQATIGDQAVGQAEMESFVASLQRQRAKKGIFVTTSSFSKEAFEYAAQIPHQIVLIHGDLLAQYMIDYDIGVSTLFTYEIKGANPAYFTKQ